MMPPGQPYVLNSKILLTTAAKIPPYVPQNFGGSKRTFWNQFERTSCDESTKCSPSPRNIPSRRVRLFTFEHRNLQSLSLWRSPSTTKLLDGSKPDTSIWFETHSYGLGSLARMPGCPHGGVAEATDHRSAPIRQSCPFTASGPAVSARPAPHRRKSICCLL